MALDPSFSWHFVPIDCNLISVRMLLSATLAPNVLFFLHYPDLVHGGEWPLCCFFFFSWGGVVFWWNQFLKPQQKGRSRNWSIRVDDNHTSAVLVKAYFHSVHYLLSVWSTHPPFFFTPTVLLPLSFSFPLVLSAVIIPLFFEVSINSSPLTNSPQTYEYMVFLSAGVWWGSP